MARGWESKSIEEQQAEASAQPDPWRQRLTAEQAAQERALQGLRLSRQLIAQQLEAASDPRRRQMLESALADIDRKIRASGT